MLKKHSEDHDRVMMRIIMMIGLRTQLFIASHKMHQCWFPDFWADPSTGQHYPTKSGDNIVKINSTIILIRKLKRWKSRAVLDWARPNFIILYIIRTSKNSLQGYFGLWSRERERKREVFEALEWLLKDYETKRGERELKAQEWREENEWVEALYIIVRSDPHEYNITIII